MSDVTDKIKGSFFQETTVSILLYGCTTWTLTKFIDKKFEGNYIRMLRAILNKSWRQCPTKLQLYGHLPPITKTIKVRRVKHARHYWRSKDELISNIPLRTPSHGRANIQQLYADTGYCLEDLQKRLTIVTGGERGSYILPLLYDEKIFHFLGRLSLHSIFGSSTSSDLLHIYMCVSVCVEIGL